MNADLKDPIRFVLIKKDNVHDSKQEAILELEICIKKSLLNLFLEKKGVESEYRFSYETIDLPNDFLSKTVCLVPYIRLQTIQNEKTRKSFQDFALAFRHKNNDANAILRSGILVRTRRFILTSL